MISFHDPQFSTSHDRVDSTAGCDPRQLQIETFEVPIEEATNLNTPLDYERERAAAPSASGERENGNS